MLTNFLWKPMAKLLSTPSVSTRLINRSKRTPYFHITSKDGNDLYMGRWWLFNPYPENSSGSARKWWHCPISIRIHWIRRPDSDRHLHDHPWNARTIILKGWYIEHRESSSHYRVEGSTAGLKFGEYHRITEVSPGGCWTLFITGPYRGTWGFKVDGQKVKWREYLGIK